MAAATLPQTLTAAAAAATMAAGLAVDLDNAMQRHWRDYPAAHQAIAGLVSTIKSNALAQVTLYVTLRDQV